MGYTRDRSESVFSILETSVFEFRFLKQLLLRNFEVDFVEICNVYIGNMIIKAAKRIFNSGKICRSYSDLNFGVTFLEHSVYITVKYVEKIQQDEGMLDKSVRQ